MAGFQPDPERPRPRTKAMQVTFAPAYIARALRWAMIDANVTEGPEPGTYEITDLDTGTELTSGRLLSALMLAYVDAGEPADTIMDTGRG